MRMRSLPGKHCCVAMGITSGLPAVAFDLDLDILHEIEAVLINDFSFRVVTHFNLQSKASTAYLVNLLCLGYGCKAP